LEYLKQNLTAWGYSTCEIHGGMSALVEKQKKDFNFTSRFVWLEAAGEGINFCCRLMMINYDLPWNPNRLEQRMGHSPNRTRAGCLHFNFVAANTVEGRVLEKLLQKLAEIRNGRSRL